MGEYIFLLQSFIEIRKGVRSVCFLLIFEKVECRDFDKESFLIFDESEGFSLIKSGCGCLIFLKSAWRKT